MSVVGSYIDVAKSYPDGGYGWVIAFGGFMCNFLVDGICYSYGLLLPHFKNEFGGGTSETALAGSLCTGCYLLMGPVSSAIENKYGARGIIIIGTLLAAIGFLLATMSPSRTYFILSWGVIGENFLLPTLSSMLFDIIPPTGCGFGLVYLPSIVVASHWFQAKRGVALGLIVSGSGIGSSLVAKLVTFLLTLYDWRGTVIVLVGIILFMAAMGTLFRPVSSWNWKKDSESEAGSENFPVIRETGDAAINGSVYHMDGSTATPSSPRSQRNYSSYTTGLSNPRLLSTANMAASQVGSTYLWQSYEDYYDPTSRHKSKKDDVTLAVRRSTYAIDRFRSSNLDLRRHQVTSSRKSLHTHQSRHTIYSGEGYYSIADIYAAQSAVGGQEGTELDFKKAVMEPLREMLDFSLLKRLSFSLLVFATVLTMMALFVPSVYIADYARIQARATVSESSTLILILGISNTMGRLIVGFLSDFSCTNSLQLNNFALIIAGLSTMAVPFLHTFIFLALYVTIFGLSIATFVCLRTIILESIFGLEYLNNSFGIMLLFHGIATVVGSPCAGMLFDMTGSYTYTFITAGLLLAFSGAICIPLRSLAEWEQRVKEGGHKKMKTEARPENEFTSASLYTVTEVETAL